MNMIVLPKNKKKKEIIMSIQVCLIPLQGKWWKEKLFLPNQGSNIVYLNVENMIVMPNHKKNGDYYENASLTHLMDKL